MLETKAISAMFSLIKTVFDTSVSITEAETGLLRDNLDELYELSKRHDLAHLVGYALDKEGVITQNDAIFTKFQEQQYIAIIKCEEMCYELNRMRAVFSENKVDFIPLKGVIMRQMYPEPWMRTSSDIDILVHREDMDTVMRLLSEGLGYSIGLESNHDLSFFTPNKIHVEIHFDLLEEEQVQSSQAILKEVWGCAIRSGEGNSEHYLPDSMFYFYHIVHMAKHMGSAGLGVRLFLDLHLLNNKLGSTDQECGLLLTQGGLARFGEVCCNLSRYWFDRADTLDKTTRKLEMFVLNCGTYGTVENGITISRHSGGSTMQYVKGRFFLPRSVMYGLYPILRRHGWLLPFCHIGRWCKLFSSKMARKVIREIKISRSATDEKIEKMQAFLKEMGLK